MHNKYPRGVTVRALARGSTRAADYAFLAETVAETGALPVCAIEVAQRCGTCGSSEHGRPFVAAPPNLTGVVRISLSRAGELTVVAVSWAGAVGIDIEQIASVRRAGFDDVAFTAAERSELGGLTVADADHARAVFWTRKEAVLKLNGVGLRVDPLHVGTSLTGNRLLSWPGSLPDMAMVRLMPVDLGRAGLVGTLAHLPNDAALPGTVGA